MTVETEDLVPCVGDDSEDDYVLPKKPDRDLASDFATLQFSKPPSEKHETPRAFTRFLTAARWISSSVIITE